MGKRSSFDRVERDFYPTPIPAMLPLLPHLPPNSTFVEPCAGNGVMMRFLASKGHTCVGAFDIEPQHPDVAVGDARFDPPPPSNFIITNPPWDRPLLEMFIRRLPTFAPTWLLFDADWVHTRQAIQYLPHLRIIQAIGRVKWIEGSKFTGKDNCAWHLFTADIHPRTVFHGQRA